MCGEDHRSTVRHIVEILDEHRSLVAQRVNDIAVVYDFMSDVDRSAVLFDREFNNVNRTINARAKAAGCSNQEAQGRLGIGKAHEPGLTRLLAWRKAGSYDAAFRMKEN